MMSTRAGGKSLVVLVDDSPNDALLAREAFKMAKLDVDLRHFSGGRAFLEALKDPSQERPALVLMDLKMPGMDGFDVLLALSQVEEYRTLPVVVLSTSESQTDIRKAYQLGCRSYICKPVDFTSFLEVVKQLDQYWFGVARLPS